ncbi:chemotaxis protein MotB [Catalinimonas alkaloidigena]|uniref:Chemotaxis protein MotB n=1 Tax=Catalinimonas alkaloidigena TaxID=1075417 RepID=A0A1G9PI18_9BACT|nr:OmpA family protein [Catalinimonas alkaloidigena]SDL98131.1 chemotaxis protein MotB [Catalinimonas alkaloidigena]
MNRFFLFRAAASAATLCLLAFPSCVSKKKYTEMTSRFEECREARATLEGDTLKYGKVTRDLREEMAFLRASASQDIQNLSGELQAKENMLQATSETLQERERRIQEMSAIIDQQNQMLSSLLGKVKDALIGFDSDELTVQMKEGKVYVSLSENLLFSSGSTQVNKEGQNALQKLAGVLAKNPDIKVMIEGHTDSIPVGQSSRFKDNWDLSVLRATSIVRILSDNGVQPAQVTAAGRGEYFPVASNESKEGRQKNRRTEIILSPDLAPLFELMSRNDSGGR